MVRTICIFCLGPNDETAEATRNLLPYEGINLWCYSTTARLYDVMEALFG